VWHDRDISAGTEWELEISKHLNEVQIILLLVSPDFMDSDYCYDVEMMRAIERHERGEACVIPIILRPTEWKDAPFGRLQSLPTDAKPVSTWRNRELAFLNIAQGIKKVIEKQGEASDSVIQNQKQGENNKNPDNNIKKMHILFVEDETDNEVFALLDFFKEDGYSVELAVNGRQALECVEKRQPDIIVLDLAMPVMEGFEVVRRLRMEGNNVPIIILTAHPDSNYLVEAYEVGADDFIVKHGSHTKLLASIETRLKEGRRQFKLWQ